MFFVILLAFVTNAAVQVRASNESNRFPRARFCRKQMALSSNPRDDCWIVRDNRWARDVEMATAKKRVADLMAQQNHTKSSSPGDVVVYIHGFVPNQDPSVGIAIIDEMLRELKTSGLMDIASNINLVGYGDIEAIKQFLMSNTSYNSVSFIDNLYDLQYFFEFPTLALMQHHAKFLNRDAKFLYLHTKGVTHGRKDPIAHFQRAHMVHYCVTLHKESMQLLDLGWHASGPCYLVAKDFNHYSGNFFWMKAGALVRNINILDLVWHWRFGAEKWPLYGMPDCRVFKSNVTSGEIWNSFRDHSMRSNWKSSKMFDITVVEPQCIASNDAGLGLDLSDWVDDVSTGMLSIDSLILLPLAITHS